MSRLIQSQSGTKKCRLRFNYNDDLALLREFVGQNPLSNPEGWEVIRQNLQVSTGKAFTVRTIKQHLILIIEMWIKKDEVDKVRSGIEDAYSERDTLLQEASALCKEFNFVGLEKQKKKTPRDVQLLQLGKKVRNSYLGHSLATNEEANQMIENVSSGMKATPEQDPKSDNYNSAWDQENENYFFNDHDYVDCVDIELEPSNENNNTEPLVLEIGSLNNRTSNKRTLEVISPKNSQGWRESNFDIASSSENVTPKFKKMPADQNSSVPACSVSVGAWTLVAISVERYYAICHPLRSLTWQTISHAYKTIMAIWIGSLICMIPIAVLSELKPTRRGNHKCRENWPSVETEKAFNIFLDIVLLVFPLMVLALTYSLISRTLWKGIKAEREFRMQASSTADLYVNLQGNSTTSWSTRKSTRRHLNWSTFRNSSEESSNSPVNSNSSRKLTTGLRRTNAERSFHNKKRVIKMLFVVVLEFFICWTPLYVINTLVLFDKDFVYNNIGYIGVSFFQLLAYSSSCCNPITYCFMNSGFRKSFLKLFRCLRPLSTGSNYARGSDLQMDNKNIKL